MKKKIYLLIDATLFVVLMNFIEAVLMPGYWIKSLIKFIYIVLSVVVYCGLFKKRFNEAELMLTNSKEFSNIRAIKNREIQNII